MVVAVIKRSFVAEIARKQTLRINSVLLRCLSDDLERSSGERRHNKKDFKEEKQHVNVNKKRYADNNKKYDGKQQRERVSHYGAYVQKQQKPYNEDDIHKRLFKPGQLPDFHVLETLHGDLKVRDDYEKLIINSFSDEITPQNKEYIEHAEKLFMDHPSSLELDGITVLGKAIKDKRNWYYDINFKDTIRSPKAFHVSNAGGLTEVETTANVLRKVAEKLENDSKEVSSSKELIEEIESIKNDVLSEEFSGGSGRNQLVQLIMKKSQMRLNNGKLVPISSSNTNTSQHESLTPIVKSESELLRDATKQEVLAAYKELKTVTGRIVGSNPGGMIIAVGNTTFFSPFGVFMPFSMLEEAGLTDVDVLTEFAKSLIGSSVTVRPIMDSRPVSFKNLKNQKEFSRQVFSQAFRKDMADPLADLDVEQDADTNDQITNDDMIYEQIILSHGKSLPRHDLLPQIRARLSAPRVRKGEFVNVLPEDKMNEKKDNLERDIELSLQEKIQKKQQNAKELGKLLKDLKAIDEEKNIIPVDIGTSKHPLGAALKADDGSPVTQPKIATRELENIDENLLKKKNSKNSNIVDDGSKKPKYKMEYKTKFNDQKNAPGRGSAKVEANKDFVGQALELTSPKKFKNNNAKFLNELAEMAKKFSKK